jgi:drug/metabolite transporter (DMT)-like permease
MLDVTYALTSSLCGGCADFVGGSQSRRRPLLTVLLGSQTTSLVIAAVIVAVSGHDAPPERALLFGLAAGLCSAMALGCLYRGLAVGTMMVVAPIAALGAVVPVVVGLAGGDDPSPVALGGILFGLVGVALATRQREEGSAADRALRVGAVLGLLAALAFGGFFVALDTAADGDPLWAVLSTRVSFVLAVVAVMLALRRPPELTRAGALPLMAVGVLDVSAAGLYAFATTTGMLSVTSVLASFPPLVVVVLAWFVLGERLRADQLVGVLLTLAGVTLIAAG